MARKYRFVLTGLGNIGLNLLKIVQERQAVLQEQYGFEFVLVGAADSSGAIADPQGLDLDRIISLKNQKRGLKDLSPAYPLLGPQAMLEEVEADMLLEATPTNLKGGEPGLTLVRTALKRGMPAVLASKGPLVLAYSELAALSDLSDPAKPALRFSGAVCGAMPTVNVGRRDLPLANIRQVEAVLNATSQLILGLMAEGQSYEEALKEAQRIGIAEPDPALDVEGWDSANKLVILANAVLKQPATLADLTVRGITGLSGSELAEAQKANRKIVLVASAVRVGGAGSRYRLAVEPRPLPPEHPLARLDKFEMGIVYDTDIYGKVIISTVQQGPEGASAAMLRDVLDILG
ncbi:MAG TPA: homoserine dehydrogenase [Chloroflexia bacterium]|nr:homoserine dehydrogenase [Chloroflexia bacterium]